MAKAKYRLKDTGGSKMVTLPVELLTAIGVTDLSGELRAKCVRFDLGQDDEGNYGIIRPAYD